MLTALWGAVKKNGALRQRVACRLKERKRSRCFVRTLLIKDFKYGPSLSLLTEIIIRRNGRKVSQFFTLTNNTTAEFDSGPKYRLVRGNRGPKYPYRASFVIF